jgi:hypothetical protein
MEVAQKDASYVNPSLIVKLLGDEGESETMELIDYTQFTVTQDIVIDANMTGKECKELLVNCVGHGIKAIRDVLNFSGNGGTLSDERTKAMWDVLHFLMPRDELLRKWYLPRNYHRVLSLPACTWLWQVGPFWPNATPYGRSLYSDIIPMISNLLNVPTITNVTYLAWLIDRRCEETGVSLQSYHKNLLSESKHIHSSPSFTLDPRGINYTNPCTQRGLGTGYDEIISLMKLANKKLLPKNLLMWTFDELSEDASEMLKNYISRANLGNMPNIPFPIALYVIMSHFARFFVTHGKEHTDAMLNGQGNKLLVGFSGEDRTTLRLSSNQPFGISTAIHACIESMSLIPSAYWTKIATHENNIITPLVPYLDPNRKSSVISSVSLRSLLDECENNN